MSNQEFINRVELAGRVGSIRVSEVSGQKMARMSLCTEQTHRSSDGALFCRSDWFAITAWNGHGIADLSTISKGAFIRVRGSLRTTAYISADGNESRFTEVLADTLEILG